MRTILGDTDLYLFREGTHTRMYEHLGAQVLDEGVHFAVWAPNASAVSVVGDFNRWDAAAHTMFPSDAGIWKGFVGDARVGQTYKYAVRGADGVLREKADPYGFLFEVPPKSATVVWDLAYRWRDDGWMAERGARLASDAPVAIYEMHLGSWRKEPNGDSLSYRELAAPLIAYVREMGYTHVEFMPVMEHPFYPSWGYQVVGYFAPTSRYGTPQDLMYLIDELHRAGIGVILDWVPSHFATDGHGLGRFDGTALYEHEDPRQGFHPDWKSYVFNYGRNEVRSFLLSSADLWLARYHADGLRVDGVASMLYLDYSRGPGEWVPNVHGGNENLEAISFLQAMNTAAYRDHPGIQTIAEESTAWPGVTRPVDAGGLGFGYKWDMGWMHDTLGYFSLDPIYRSHHHDALTFRMLYAYDEHFVLTLSHDEVVHGKGSLYDKMPGDRWQKLANVRALFGYMYGLPGKKCMFMGDEFAQEEEWSVDGQLDWDALSDPGHAGVRRWVGDLDAVYRREAALAVGDDDPDGFAWIVATDREASVYAFERRAPDARPVVVVANLTPVVRHGYRIGVSVAGVWEVLLDSDAEAYGGSGVGPGASVTAEDVPVHGRPWSVVLELPPLGILMLAPAGVSP